MGQGGHAPLRHGLAQEGTAPRARAQQAQQDPDGRRLARTVRAQEPIGGTHRYGEVDAVDGGHAPEELGQTPGLDGQRRARGDHSARCGRAAQELAGAAAGEAPAEAGEAPAEAEEAPAEAEEASASNTLGATKPA